MKLTIKRIIEPKKANTYNNFTSYSWTVDAANEQGQIINSIWLVSWKDLDIQENQTIECEVENKVSKAGKPYTQYKIKSPKKEWGGYKKVEKVSIVEFDQLVTHCWKLSEGLSKEHASQLFDKIMGCASMMVDCKTLGINEQVQDSINKLNNVMGAEVKDENIPF